MDSVTVVFQRENGEAASAVYCHAGADRQMLEAFFDEVERVTPRSTRFDDPEYLAAKFVVWMMQGDLRNIGCGVVHPDYIDTPVRYVVCRSSGRPAIS